MSVDVGGALAGRTWRKNVGGVKTRGISRGPGNKCRWMSVDP